MRHGLTICDVKKPRGVIVAATAVAAFTTAACVSSGSMRGSSTPTPSPDPVAVAEWNGACSALGLSGRLVAISGGDPLNAELYNVPLCPVQQYRLTMETRFSALGAKDDAVVVASARNGVDRLEMVEVNELRPVAGLGSPRAFSPAVSSRGVIAYIDPERSAAGLTALRSWDPAAMSGQLLAETAEDFSALDYGPQDQLAAVEVPLDAREGSGSSLVIFTGSAGEPQRFTVPLPDVAMMTWGAGGLIALSPPSSKPSPAVVVDASDGRVVAELPPGWTVRDWSPDGASLLVRREDITGIWQPTKPSEVVELGRLATGPIYDAVWLADDS